MPKLYGKTNPTITWSPNTEPDLAGYKIYWGASPGVYTSNVSVAVGTTSRIMTGISPIQKWYYFALTAYDTSGNESAFSAEVKFYISDPYTRDSTQKTVLVRG